MNRYNLIDRESYQPFFSLLLFCGIALIISIPPARRIGQFETFSTFSGFPIYFYTHALFMGIFGLNVGATSAARSECGQGILLLLGGRILLAQFLTLPYILFQHALYPGKEVALFLILLYTTVVALLCAVSGRLIEEPGRQGSGRGFLLKYALLISYCVVPMLILPVLSPLGMVANLLQGERAALLAFAFVVPVLLLAGVSFVLDRRVGGGHRV